MSVPAGRHDMNAVVGSKDILFLVFDTGYITGALDDPRDTRWNRRTGVVKLTYLKAF